MIYTFPSSDLFFLQNRKNNLKIHMKLKRHPHPQQNSPNKSLKRNQVGECQFLISENIYYKAIVIKTVCYWYKDGHIDQYVHNKNAKQDPHTYGKVIFISTSQ